MLITDIYAKYKILPFLQLHQLRVAAVTKQICDTSTVTVDAESAVIAALLHDMGNILKASFAVFPEATQPEGVGYWESVKDDFRKNYGNDEYRATFKIVDEIGVSDNVKSLLRAVGMPNVIQTAADPSLEKKIVSYSDQRVAPYGVVSLAERLDEGGKRWAAKIDRESAEEHQLVTCLYEIERQIFAYSTITPDAITSASTEPLLSWTRQVQIADGSSKIR